MTGGEKWIYFLKIDLFPSEKNHERTSVEEEYSRA